MSQLISQHQEVSLVPMKPSPYENILFLKSLTNTDDFDGLDFKKCYFRKMKTTIP